MFNTTALRSRIVLYIIQCLLEIIETQIFLCSQPFLTEYQNVFHPLFHCTVRKEQMLRNPALQIRLMLQCRVTIN